MLLFYNTTNPGLTFARRCTIRRTIPGPVLLRRPVRRLSLSFEEKIKESGGCKNTLCCTYLKDSAMTAHMIRVRIGGCTAYTSVVNFKPGDSVETWKYGIELQWIPPN
ncbi:hypothetical protein IC582_011552 [Cucumis melo]